MVLSESMTPKELAVKTYNDIQRKKQDRIRGEYQAKRLRRETVWKFRSINYKRNKGL